MDWLVEIGCMCNSMPQYISAKAHGCCCVWRHSVDWIGWVFSNVVERYCICCLLHSCVSACTGVNGIAEIKAHEFFEGMDWDVRLLTHLIIKLLHCNWIDDTCFTYALLFIPMRSFCMHEALRLHSHPPSHPRMTHITLMPSTPNYLLWVCAHLTNCLYWLRWFYLSKWRKTAETRAIP